MRSLRLSSRRSRSSNNRSRKTIPVAQARSDESPVDFVTVAVDVLTTVLPAETSVTVERRGVVTRAVETDVTTNVVVCDAVNTTGVVIVVCEVTVPAALVVV